MLNGLIQFTLFLMGKCNSKVEKIESRTASWNGFCSTFEGPLCIYIQAQQKEPFIHSFIHVFIPLFIPSSVHQSFLRPVHSLFQSELSTRCTLVLPLSVCIILPFPWGHPVAAYLFFLLFSSVLSFLQLRVCKAFPTQEVTNSVSLPSFYCS
jgi:hypothetical protein